MCISPAMLNKAKRIPLREIACNFEGKEYTTFLPAKPYISVSQFLESFAKNNIKSGNFNSYDLELVKNNKILPYEYQIQNESFASIYEIYYSKLTYENYLHKVNNEDSTFEKYENDWYPKADSREESLTEKRKRNFFTYLVDKFPKFKVDNESLKQHLEVKNMFNTEAALKQAEENKSKILNQWLYNNNTYPHIISPLNLQNWDSFYHKNMMLQILGALSNFTPNLEVDVDSSVRGVYKREFQVDFMVKNRQLGINTPVSIVDDIDCTNIFDVVRDIIYDKYLPKEYPNFIYELIKPENPQELSPDVLKKVDYINKKY